MPSLPHAYLLPLLACLSAAEMRADAKSPPPEPLASHSFSFLPRSLQKHPSLPIAIITEMTDDGRKVRVPTAAQPMYYLAQAAGYHDEGQAYGETKAMPVAELQGLLEHALASNQYLPADAAHPARMIMVFSWGSANKFDYRTDPDEPADAIGRGNYATRMNFLARAQLVGGSAFARSVENALNQEDEMLASGSKVIGPRPLELLANRDERIQQLLEQSLDDCYYVVASAYDALAMAHGQRRLLWRTHLTVNSNGVAMAETLPVLIQNGTPYFGRDMKTAATVRAGLDREGHVEIGTATVISSETPGPTGSK